MKQKAAVAPVKATTEKKVIELEKSVPEQIYDELIKALSTTGEFDSETIEKLHSLMQNGEIRKAPQVIKAIKKLEE